jgi:hypothetical protein
LISEKQRGFFAKCRRILAGIYFSTDKSMDRVHARTEGGRGAAVRSLKLGLRPLRCAKAHQRGCNRERSAQGARLEPHRGSGGVGGRVTAVKVRWRRCSVRGLLRRRCPVDKETRERRPARKAQTKKENIFSAKTRPTRGLDGPAGTVSACGGGATSGLAGPKAKWAARMAGPK